MFEQIQEMIVKQLKVPKEKVVPEARLLEDLNADSANVMMLVMDLEQAFDVMMEDDALLTVKTVGDLVDYIEKKKA